MLSAFVVLAAIVFALVIISTRRYKKWMINYPGNRLRSPVPLTTASVILGIGLGGFLDGILLHQVFQVHEMLSNKIPATDYVGKSINMFWDGIFHLFCLLVVLTGIILLWKTARRKEIDKSGNLLAGGLLVGWALFNIVEGIIDHQVLKLHNVIELSPDHSPGNYGFLVISFIMLCVGALIIKKKPALNTQSAGQE
ncbi:DUF2243 domain-containing protein [Filimonas effusa]|nr:DUF2243 domain-containing protein [Filimonas effusa]